MEARYELAARRLRDQLNELREDLAEARLRRERAEADLGGTPRRRDRSRFVNSLLNGDAVTFERKAPLWRELRRCSRAVKRIERRTPRVEAKLTAVVHKGLKRGDAEYRSMSASLRREKHLRRSCRRLLNAISTARRLIGAKSNGDVAKALRRVRSCGLDVNRMLPAHQSVGLDAIRGLGNHELTKPRLDGIEQRTKAVLTETGVRERDIAARRRARAEHVRARFT
ncbi:hypothetical protein [Actinophytocola gossypii]|uniref:CHAD domain-containing protein n=1 Tax=Actinophytocola gossypii TaxID=2812003 RepID=A0ABT2J1Z8_9PSEU|nr:hypothetical protein [Actinophytocola gossypii]MCT2581882.1 hypothetical protein [Actinophytocola gossypii]